VAHTAWPVRLRRPGSAVGQQVTAAEPQAARRRPDRDDVLDVRGVLKLTAILHRRPRDAPQSRMVAAGAAKLQRRPAGRAQARGAGAPLNETLAHCAGSYVNGSEERTRCAHLGIRSMQAAKPGAGVELRHQPFEPNTRSLLAQRGCRGRIWTGHGVTYVDELPLSPRLRATATDRLRYMLRQR
jgi:hypothetical protein